jgi:hypothetical protein
MLDCPSKRNTWKVGSEFELLPPVPVTLMVLIVAVLPPAPAPPLPVVLVVAAVALVAPPPLVALT